MGRARIEQQKQVELANIQAEKEENLKKLNIQYETADKAKTSFGYIGIAFLTILFGSIFGNDLIKLLIYYFYGFREWRSENEEQEKEKRKQDEVTSNDVRLEIDQYYASKLDEGWERVYFKLVKVNARIRRNDKTSV